MSCEIVSTRTTHVMRKTGNDGNPDLISTNREMWIRSNEEVVEQTHIGHGLSSLDVVTMYVCLTITHECARRRTQVRCLLRMWRTCPSLSQLYDVRWIVALQPCFYTVVAFWVLFIALYSASFAIEAAAAGLSVTLSRYRLARLRWLGLWPIIRGGWRVARCA